LCISLYSFGVFFHFAADMQKYTALQVQPGHLISCGLFSSSRNMNYFGELLIYSGFGLLAVHWLPIAILLLWIAVIWLPNMRKKDASLSRYADFAAYQQRSKLFIPFIY
jgi:steroid 5-alpha reductase family enzyme